MTDKPNPGSREAIHLGCTCPVIDNHHGRGAEGKPDQFWIVADCPLHGVMEEADASTDPASLQPT